MRSSEECAPHDSHPASGPRGSGIEGRAGRSLPWPEWGSRSAEVMGLPGSSVPGQCLTSTDRSGRTRWKRTAPGWEPRADASSDPDASTVEGVQG